MTAAAPASDILQVVCNEPEPVTHTVRKMILTPENLRKFWDKSRQFKTLFTSEIRGDFKKFLELFLSDGPNGIQCNGLFWVVDDFVGIMYITDIIPGLDAKCHVSFFDRRLNGREPLFREMIKYVLERYDFHRLTIEVALYANASYMRLVEAVGFKKEGRRRSFAWYEGQWFDVNLYGILRNEI